MNTFSSVVVGLAVLAVALIGMSLLTNPVLRRIAVRNFSRRPTNTALVIAGSMVGTALITGSLVIGDTTEGLGLAQIVRTGEIDEVVSVFPRFEPETTTPPDLAAQGETLQSEPATSTGQLAPDERGRFSISMADRAQVAGLINLETLRAATQAAAGFALVDGVMPVMEERVPVQKVDVSTGNPLLVESRVLMLGLDWDSMRSFGSSPQTLPRPSTGEVLVPKSLARDLELSAGDTVQLFTPDGPNDFVVRDIVESHGFSAYSPRYERIPGPILVSLADAQNMLTGGLDGINSIFISNIGGVTESIQHYDRVEEAVESILGPSFGDAENEGPIRYYMNSHKPEATEDGMLFGEMFLTLSAFAIAAGVMLVLNIYTMFAEERRTEMGVERALGMRRGHLVRLYVYEGILYGLGAAAAGVLVGLGLARAVVWGLNRLQLVQMIDPNSPQVDFIFTFDVESLLLAAAGGMLLTLATVAITSSRISRINIVAAMGDRPDPPRPARRSGLVTTLFIVLLGLALSAFALIEDNGYLYVAGPSLAGYGLATLLQRYLPSRPVWTLTLLLLVAYSQLSFLIPAVDEANEEQPFIPFLTGMILVLSSIGLVALNFAVVTWLTRQTIARIRRVLPVVQVGVAYPAARPEGTGLSLGMFSLVIFMITLISTITAFFDGRFDEIKDAEAGGYDAIIDDISLMPVRDLEERLQRSEFVDSEGVLEVSTLMSAFVELPQFLRRDFRPEGVPRRSNDDNSPVGSNLTLVDDVFLATTRSVLDARASEFGSDREVWDALAADSTLVVIDGSFSGTGGWNRPKIEPGNVIRMAYRTGPIEEDRGPDKEFEKRVVGRLVDSPLGGIGLLGGIIMSREGMIRDLAMTSTPPFGDGYLLRFSPETDHKKLANGIEKELIASGAQVKLVSEMLGEAVAFFGLFRILQGFMAFGLVVGVAGLAVVAARAVHQRKQQIGTLRALGFRRGMVLSYFLLEASVVSVLGIVLGVGSGTISGFAIYQYLFKEEIGGGFVFPAASLALLAAAVYLASLAFTLAPALRASSLAPAEALRPKE